jgi:hypothetical protein
MPFVAKAATWVRIPPSPLKVQCKRRVASPPSQSERDMIVADQGCESERVQDGKHLPKARSKRGDPFRRIFRVSNAQTRLRSFRRNPSHARLSAVTRKSGEPTCPCSTRIVLSRITTLALAGSCPAVVVLLVGCEGRAIAGIDLTGHRGRARLRGRHRRWPHRLPDARGR